MSLTVCAAVVTVGDIALYAGGIEACQPVERVIGIGNDLAPGIGLLDAIAGGIIPEGGLLDEGGTVDPCLLYTSDAADESSSVYFSVGGG